MKLRALGVYIFAGGFSLGVRKHFKLMAHLEEWPFGCETSRRNLKIPVYEGINEWPGAIAKMKQEPPHFIYANPPCAPWSVASHGRKTHWSDDPRLACFWRYFDVVKQLNPHVSALESVRAMWTKAPDLIGAAATKAAAAGYHTSVIFVDSQYHGIAQSRKRVFVVFHRVALDVQPPRKEPVTVGEALSGVSSKTNYRIHHRHDHTMELLQRVRPGESVRKAWDRENARKLKAAIKRGDKKIKTRPSFLLSRLTEDGICGAMTGDIAHVHPTEHRFLYVEEAMALCGFPQSYQFDKRIPAAELARGVMPPVGEWLAKQVSKSIQRKVPADNLPSDRVGLYTVFPRDVTYNSVSINDLMTRRT